MIEQIVKAKLENNYFSKQRHSLKTDYLIKKIDSRYFFYLLVDSKNSICQYGRLWVLEDLYLLVLRKVHDQIASDHLRY